MNDKYEENDDIWDRVAAEYSERCMSRSDVDHRLSDDAIRLLTHALFASNGETLRNELMDLWHTIKDAVSQEIPDLAKCKLLISAMQPYIQATHLDDGFDNKLAKTNIVIQLERDLSKHLDPRNLFITATQQYLDNAAIMESPPKNVHQPPRFAPSK
jgi:hypothetical protein